MVELDKKKHRRKLESHAIIPQREADRKRLPISSAALLKISVKKKSQVI